MEKVKKVTITYQKTFELPAILIEFLRGEQTKDDGYKVIIEDKDEETCDPLAALAIEECTPTEEKCEQPICECQKPIRDFSDGTCVTCKKRVLWRK